MLDLSGLNAPQREAVLHGEGPLLVLAGAGSGKTRVITYRVAKLLERGFPARSICALSFTNKAAEEMRERCALLVGARAAEELTMSTFHALGLEILKREREALGWPRGFTIYDAADQLGALREVLRSIKIDDRRFDPKAILHRISRAKNAFVGPEDYEGHGGAPRGFAERGGGAQDAAPLFDEYDEITKIAYPKYQQALRAFAAVDFDDLITETVKLLETHDGARERWEGRFRWLLVDEYQDTNRAQLLLVRRLAARHGNVTVVGDDDQSIYGWRGAEASNILEFERHFPGARIVKLEQNYRSTPTILDAANAVIRNNAARHAKALWSDKPRGEEILVAICRDADEEAKFVCDELERLRVEERRRYSDCAVLYRSNVQSAPLEAALRERRIPFELHGGQEFYERKEIKDVIAYLKVALNPRDEISLRRIVNYPARGIGPATVEKAAARGGGLWEALRQEAAAGRAAVAGFVALIERTRAGVQAPGRAAEAARALVEEIRLYDDLRDAAATLAAAQRRIDNVEDFLRALAAQEQRAPGAEALGQWLHLLTLKSTEDDAAEGGDRVTLSTLHGAKGLEWPVVLLVGWEEELLPHARTLYPQGPDVAGEVDVSEERRLAYVGITRARERLVITRALQRRKHGKDRIREPSRFLLEIPSELTETRDLLAAARAPVDTTELRGFFQGLLKDR